ncbi:hypothetical protein BKI52_37895 [marine bacterium AO1-C]|nr:hypothetical protein BKI52_37895 [marine bacterium AO1-C]
MLSSSQREIFPQFRQYLLILFCLLFFFRIGHAQVSVVKDINPGTFSSNPQNFIAWNGKVYFKADFGLWVSDGTEAGTQLLKRAFLSAARIEFVIFNNKLFFHDNAR